MKVEGSLMQARFIEIPQVFVGKNKNKVGSLSNKVVTLSAFCEALFTNIKWQTNRNFLKDQYMILILWCI